MEIENAVYPTGEQLGALMALPKSGPVVMLNLLKFRAKAEYKDGRATELSGLEAYTLYGQLMTRFVTERGGKLHFTAPASAPVIGSVGEMWDMVALMEYPSPQAFVEIATSPEVAEFGVHREAGLAGQLLIPCLPQ
jgi:hypothetical protein